MLMLVLKFQFTCCVCQKLFFFFFHFLSHLKKITEKIYIFFMKIKQFLAFSCTFSHGFKNRIGVKSDLPLVPGLTRFLIDFGWFSLVLEIFSNRTSDQLLVQLVEPACLVWSNFLNHAFGLVLKLPKIIYFNNYLANNLPKNYGTPKCTLKVTVFNSYKT